jgi:hypothetical protein
LAEGLSRVAMAFVAPWASAFGEAVRLTKRVVSSRLLHRKADCSIDLTICASQVRQAKYQVVAVKQREGEKSCLERKVFLLGGLDNR